jgi:hypothetical protein
MAYATETVKRCLIDGLRDIMSRYCLESIPAREYPGVLHKEREPRQDEARHAQWHCDTKNLD